MVTAWSTYRPMAAGLFRSKIFSPNEESRLVSVSPMASRSPVRGSGQQGPQRWKSSPRCWTTRPRPASDILSPYLVMNLSLNCSLRVQVHAEPLPPEDDVDFATSGRRLVVVGTLLGPRNATELQAGEAMVFLEVTTACFVQHLLALYRGGQEQWRWSGYTVAEA